MHPLKNNVRKAAGIILFMILYLLILPIAVFSQELENLPAKQLAADFMTYRKQNLQNIPGRVSVSELEQAYRSASGVAKPVFVYQKQNDGFVVISRQNNGYNIVGYADKGNFHADSMPPQLLALLRFYEDSLNISDPDLNNIKRANPVVEPLLDAYGVMLNQFDHEEAGNCPTGCVATAVAQIMKYHSIQRGIPITGSGSHCYNDGIYGEICADFEGIEYSSDELLSFHAGVSMEMQYCGSPYGSIPNRDFSRGLDEHFSYYTINTLEEDFYMRNELENQRPFYAAIYGVPTGHAVVIDGYDDRGFYHVNFGWGGYFNGYFLLNANKMISPGGVHRFSTNISNLRMIVPYILPVNEQDSLALLAVHHAMGGYAATGWDISQPVMRWPGVFIMNERVIELHLTSSVPPATAQSIAPETGELSALRKLWLSGTFNGNIPASLAQLTELRELQLHNNYLYDTDTETMHTGNISGELPSNIGDLVNLEWLSVSNALEGTIPSTIGNLTNLKLLRIYQDTTYFGQGNLQGEIPVEICNLTQLQNLTISNQKLSGSIPANLNNLSALTEIDLSGNQLSGTIPVFNLPGLWYLKLNNNLFSAVEEGDANCPVLKTIEWQDNEIEGELSAYFYHFPQLLNLNLSNNKIQTLSNELGKISKLESINLDNNELTSLPDGISILYNLKELTAANNHLSYVPSNLGQSHNLERINLSENMITDIPEEIGNCPGLWEVKLNDNKITSIPGSFGNLRDGVSVYLHNNEIQGSIPEALITAGAAGNKFVTLGGNRFVYSNIPDSDNIGFDVRNQKEVPLTQKVFKVQTGDTIHLDIRSISNLSHTGNVYYWLPYPVLTDAMHDDERFDGVENNPVLKLVINQNNIHDQYYCKVFNPNVPDFHFNYQGTVVEGTCMEFLNTDTISFQLATDEEILTDAYEDEFVTSLASLSGNAVSDGTVRLVPPLKVKRGEVYWEASVDGESWVSVSNDMENAELRANLQHVSSIELVLMPVNDAWYRCVIAETNCAPLYSAPLKVNAPGTVLFDEIINVTEEPMTIDVDSIEVVVPTHFYDSDFRLTITKLEHPPAAPDSVNAAPVYDVSVDFANDFAIPLTVKFKNLNKSAITEEDTDNYKGVYFDDKEQQWKIFDHTQISLKDSTLAFSTYHLTKLSWWNTESAWGYTDYYERNNIRVYYKDDDLNHINLYASKQTAQPWHVAEIPLFVQDITEYLPQVISKYTSLGLPDPGGRFNVFIKDLKGDDGVVGIMGMLSGYITLGRTISDPVALRQVLAHEFMHYQQDHYVSAHGGNQFWLEAHATLSDRIVWDDSEIPLAESEETLLGGRTGRINYTFNSLANSWDAWDMSIATNNLFGDLQYYYVAGSFLHYMRSYREGGSKLKPAELLKETSWFGSWRTYLGSYTNNHLGALLGDEYEEYVKYLLTGANEKFTVINTSGNPYAYIQDPKNRSVFTHPVSYLMKPGDELIQTDEIDISVPYLASRVVLLENMNPDTMMLVNYKRKHEFTYHDMVYYVTWDHQKKQMEFLDISDSAEFNFLLDARTRKNSEKGFKNYSFLLLINKRYIGASSLIDDFDASFELTAMPLLNVEKTAMLNIYNGNSPIAHTFHSTSSGSTKAEYIFFGNPSALFLHNSTSFSAYEVKWATTKEVTSGQTYEVKNSYTLVFDEGVITGIPTMKDSTVYVQTFEHDILTNNLKITEHEKKHYFLNEYVEYYEVLPGQYEERLVYPNHLSRIEENTKTYRLHDVFSYMKPPGQPTGWEEVYGDHLILFETANTVQTQQVVNDIDASYHISYYDQSGMPTSTEAWNYVSTNFSPEGLKLLFIVKISEE